LCRRYIPELIPELAALRVACKGAAGVVIKDLIDLVRKKGEAFNSEKQHSKPWRRGASRE
jgi:hypothetical protein